MGIPHLITFLRPYAESESLVGYDVIVDGPGLCYNIHYKCLSRRADTRNALEAAPSYKELGEAAIEWLSGLRSSSATVKRIYFDGFLPPAKLNTRLKRLESQTRQSIDYYNAHPIPCRALSNGRANALSSIFAGQAPRPALTNLPPPPFLVPAILEALTKSEYKDVTEVVPGEADLYCARYLKQYGGVIFTGDSDLLVHDLGPNGAVTFFKDVEIPSDGKVGALQSQIYHSAAIAVRLGLPKSHGLLALAFEMIMDNHGTFQKLLEQAVSLKAVKAHENMYEDFCKEYVPLNTEVREATPSSIMQIIFQSLDPRISEIVLQFPTTSKLAGQDAATGRSSQGTPHIFIPFLLGCPVRTSAWEMSTSVRQLAYGLLNLIVSDHERRFTVCEHRRQQKNASSREWQLPTITEIPNACMAVVNLIDQVRQKLPKSPEEEIWLALALCHDIEWASSLDKTPLSHQIMDQLFGLQDPTRYHKNCSWDVIQFLAQIHGSYYSFRILKQISSLVLAHGNGEGLPEAVLLLHGSLKMLPGFCSIPDLGSVSSMYHKIGRNSLLKIAYEVLGIEEPAPVRPVEVPIKSPKKKRKRKRGTVSIGSSPSKKKLTNPFELLEQE